MTKQDYMDAINKLIDARLRVADIKNTRKITLRKIYYALIERGGE